MFEHAVRDIDSAMPIGHPSAALLAFEVDDERCSTKDYGALTVIDVLLFEGQHTTAIVAPHPSGHVVEVKVRLGQETLRNWLLLLRFLSHGIFFLLKSHDCERFRPLVPYFASELTSVYKESLFSLEVLDEATAVYFFSNRYKGPLIPMLLEDIESEDVKEPQLLF